jgi:Sec-independent protein translocase protein TatA
LLTKNLIVLITTSETSIKLCAFIGGFELLIVVVVGIMVFGSKFPEVIRQVSKLWFRLRRTMNDIKRETGIEQTLDELRRDVDPFSPAGSGPEASGFDAYDEDAKKEEPEKAAVEFIRDEMSATDSDKGLESE